MQLRLGTPCLLSLICILSLTPSFARAGEANYWISGNDAAVVTNNDCGYVSAVHGQPMIIRSFHDSESTGIAANVTDRVYSGDEVRVPVGGRLEIISGANVVAVFGGNARVKFGGLRTFSAGSAREASRLDLDLLAGEMRVQVRRNETRPESVLASAGMAEFLVRQGDAALANTTSWQGMVLNGEARVRLRRGGTVGAPFSLDKGVVLGASGPGRLGESQEMATRMRLPFSFELTRAALPPLPSMAYELEAP